MKLAFILAPIVLVGCASNKDYAAFLAAQQSAAVQHSEAVKARYQAMASIANSGDASSKTAAVMAMAMLQPPQVQLPAPPEDPIFKWASIIMPAVTNLGANYFTYRLGAINSNNAAATTTAAYNAFGGMATAGYNAVQGTATAGFSANSTIAGFIQAPQANVTTTTTTTNNTTNNTTSTTNNTTSNTTNTTTSTTNSNNRTCQGGSGATGGGGGSGTTTGGAGAPGGTGGSATC